jgi:hypothetical protein
MTLDNQPAAAPGSGPLLGAFSEQPRHPARTWTGRSDAVQLSRLGGVLNAFATDASSSLDRIGRLQAAVRDHSYSVDETVLSRKLVSEMTGKR